MQTGVIGFQSKDTYAKAAIIKYVFINYRKKHTVIKIINLKAHLPILLSYLIIIKTQKKTLNICWLNFIVLD